MARSNWFEWLFELEQWLGCKGLDSRVCWWLSRRLYALWYLLAIGYTKDYDQEDDE